MLLGKKLALGSPVRLEQLLPLGVGGEPPQGKREMSSVGKSPVFEAWLLERGLAQHAGNVRRERMSCYAHVYVTCCVKWLSGICVTCAVVCVCVCVRVHVLCQFSVFIGSLGPELLGGILARDAACMSRDCMAKIWTWPRDPPNTTR